MTYSGKGNANVNDGSNYVDSGVTPGSGAQLLREGSDFYRSSFADIASYQHRSVTEQIQRYHQLYGGSDNTQQGGLAASKSLNYAKAPTMQQALHVRVTSIPFTFKFTGQVGLFGAENAYVAIDLDIQNVQNLRDGAEVNTYKVADINYSVDNEPINTYAPAYVADGCPGLLGPYDPDPPTPPSLEYQNQTYINYCVQSPSAHQGSNGLCTGVAYVDPNNGQITLLPNNCYENALITDVLPSLNDPKVSVNLTNIGTGNIYIDKWMETMLYKRTQEMWGYDKMYVDPRYTVYLGLHARNTRHLPYNVEVTIGQELLDSGQIKEKELIATSTIVY